MNTGNFKLAKFEAVIVVVEAFLFPQRVTVSETDVIFEKEQF